MVDRFFSTRHSCGGTTGPISLLSGPPSCGKTSLLFQYALNCVADQGHGQGYIVFICDRRRFDSKPPFLSQGINPSSCLFQQIQIKYVEDDEAIKKYFAAFHLLYPPPIAVMVDDFGDFFHERYCNARGRDLAMFRVLALCQSAIIHANKTAPCKLLLSDTHHGDAPRPLFLYKRWVSSIFTVEAQGHGLGSFLLKNAQYLKSSAGTKWTARYSIAHHHLVLEEITEDAQPEERMMRDIQLCLLQQ